MIKDAVYGTESDRHTHRGDTLDTFSSEAISRHLAELAELDYTELLERIRHIGKDRELGSMLASTDPDQIEDFLAEAGFVKGEGVPDEKTCAYQEIWGAYCHVLARDDPSVFANWLVSRGGDQNLFLHIRYLASHEPEMAAGVVRNAGLDRDEMTLAYGVMFEAAAEEDPERAIRLFNTLEFEDQDLKHKAMSSIIGMAEGREIGPERVAEILAQFTEATLNSDPDAVKRAGGIMCQRPVEDVLALFPLDGKSWQRVVAVAFLEQKAYQGMKGDVEVREFLRSESASLLSELERERLRMTLGD